MSNLSRSRTLGSEPNLSTLSNANDQHSVIKKLNDICRDEDFTGNAWRINLLDGLKVSVDRNAKPPSVLDLQKELQTINDQLKCGGHDELQPLVPRKIVTSFMVEEDMKRLVEEGKSGAEGLASVYKGLDELIFEPQRVLGSRGGPEVHVSQSFVHTLSLTTKTLKTIQGLKLSAKELNQLLKN